MQCDRQRVFKLGGGVLPLLRDFSLKRCWPDCGVSRQSRSTHSDTAKAPEQTDGCKRRKALDIVAERLRRWTANPLGSPRVGSNPIDVGYDITRKEPMPIEYFFWTRRRWFLGSILRHFSSHRLRRLFWFSRCFAILLIIFLNCALFNHGVGDWQSLTSCGWILWFC